MNWGIAMNNQDQSLIFEVSKEGRVGYSLPELDVPETDVTDVIDEGISEMNRQISPKCPSLILCAIIRLYLGATTEWIRDFIRSVRAR